MRALAACAAAPWLVALTCSLARAEPTPAAPAPDRDDFVTDAEGRRVRVRFDPGRRFVLGAGASTGATDDPARGEDLEVAAAARFEIGLFYRHAIDFEDEG